MEELLLRQKYYETIYQLNKIVNDLQEINTINDEFHQKIKNNLLIENKAYDEDFIINTTSEFELIQKELINEIIPNIKNKI